MITRAAESGSDIVREENGCWLLMEAELIEPDLYLGMDTQGGAAFARDLLGTIQRGMDRSA